MLYLAEIFGVSFCLLSVILGAFGAHLLKKILPKSALESFEVGVRYLMYHGLALLILPILYLDITIWIEIFFILGTFLFSFSIFFLSIQSIIKFNLKWLGPITPIGGTILIIGWVILLFEFISPYLS